MKTRLFCCQGVTQLVAAVVAAHSCGSAGPARDTLLLHDFFAPDDQAETFARVLRQAAELLGDWERIVYLPASQTKEIAQQCYEVGPDPAAEQLRSAVGLDRVDELYASLLYSGLSGLLPYAYRGGVRTCYGDGIGVNFSPRYFAHPPLPTSSWQRLRQSLVGVPARLRGLVRRLRHGRPPRYPAMEFERYCLLLPNLFDQTLSNVVLAEAERYREGFALLGQLLDEVPFPEDERLQEVLATHSEVVLLLTGNHAEGKRVSVEGEIEAYREFVVPLVRTPNPALVIKPHPREAPEKIDRLEAHCRDRFARCLTLRSETAFLLPFETLFSRYFQGTGRDLRVHLACVSSSCLSLERLYGQRCHIGFGEDLVRKHFFPHWVEKRLRQEADLRRAVRAIRSGRDAVPVKVEKE